MAKETKQTDATEQRLKSLKAQNEAAKIALKQRELDVAEREQEFVEPSEFQRAKILTEMLPSRGGSSLGAQAIRMPMSRPKPIYSPNALRTPIASPQEEIQAKQLDMLDKLSMIEPEKVANIRAVTSEVNDMAIRAAKLGFDITGGIGYDPTNEAHRELHQEYIRKRDWALSESKSLQRLRELENKYIEQAKDFQEFDYKGDVGGFTRGMLSRDPRNLDPAVTEFNNSLTTLYTNEQVKQANARRQDLILDFEKRKEEALAQGDVNRVYDIQRNINSLENPVKNLEQEKLYLEQAKEKRLRTEAETKGDKDAMNIKKIVDPFVLLQEGMGGEEIGKGVTEWEWSGFLDDGSKIDKVRRNADGSITVLVSGKSTEKDDYGNVKGWQGIDDLHYNNAYEFFNAYMNDKKNELDVDRVDFFNKFEELGYGRDGTFSPSDILEDYEGKKATKTEQVKFDEKFNELKEVELNKIKKDLEDDKTVEITRPDGVKHTIVPDFNYVFGAKQYQILDEDGNLSKDMEEIEEKGGYGKAEDFSFDEIINILNKEDVLLERKVWVSNETGEIVNNPALQNEKKAKQISLREYGRKYVDEYKGGKSSKSKAVNKDEAKDEVEDEFGDFVRPQ